MLLCKVSLIDNKKNYLAYFLAFLLVYSNGSWMYFSFPVLKFVLTFFIILYFICKQFVGFYFILFPF